MPLVQGCWQEYGGAIFIFFEAAVGSYREENREYSDLLETMDGRMQNLQLQMYSMKRKLRRYRRRGRRRRRRRRRKEKKIANGQNVINMTGPFSSADDDTGADTDTFDSSTQSESGESDLEHSTHNDEGSEEEEEEGEGKMEGLDQGAKALGFFSSIRNTQLAKKKMLGLLTRKKRLQNKARLNKLREMQQVPVDENLTRDDIKQRAQYSGCDKTLIDVHSGLLSNSTAGEVMASHQMPSQHSTAAS